MSEERPFPLRLLPPAEVAAIYGVTTKTVERWEREGKIPRAHVSRHRFKRWLSSAIEQHILSMREAELQEAAS